MNIQTVEVDLDGRKITLETGKMAKQANGAVVVRSGDSVVLVTACMAAEAQTRTRAFSRSPCDYREYTYAAGKIPGRLHQARRPSVREGNSHQPPDRPPDPPAVPRRLPATRPRSSPWCSRPIPSSDPDIAGHRRRRRGARHFRYSVPPRAGRRARRHGGRQVHRQSHLRQKAATSKLNIVVAGTEDGIVMVEAGAQQVSEAEVLGAIEFGHDCCKKIAAGIRELVKLAGKPKRDLRPPGAQSGALRPDREEASAPN